MAEARWRNVFGDEVDLDNIDRVYALNIYTMYVLNCGIRGFRPSELCDDALVEKLRGVILNGRAPNWRDRLRARRYNKRCRREGLPYRAEAGGLDG